MLKSITSLKSYKEIVRLTTIIMELESYLKESIDLNKFYGEYELADYAEKILDKLKELKEGK